MHTHFVAFLDYESFATLIFHAADRAKSCHALRVKGLTTFVKSITFVLCRTQELCPVAFPTYGIRIP